MVLHWFYPSGLRWLSRHSVLATIFTATRWRLGRANQGESAVSSYLVRITDALISAECGVLSAVFFADSQTKRERERERRTGCGALDWIPRCLISFHATKRSCSVLPTCSARWTRVYGAPIGPPARGSQSGAGVAREDDVIETGASTNGVLDGASSLEDRSVRRPIRLFDERPVRWTHGTTFSAWWTWVYGPRLVCRRAAANQEPGSHERMTSSKPELQPMAFSMARPYSKTDRFGSQSGCLMSVL